MDFVRVGYFIPLNGPLNGHPPSRVMMKRVKTDEQHFVEGRHFVEAAEGTADSRNMKQLYDTTKTLAGKWGVGMGE